MTCPECGGEQLAFAVPDDLREYAPADASAAAICTSCLSLQPVDDPPTERPDFSRVSDAFPEGAAAVPMALVVGLLDSLALYRAELQALVDRVERAGVDPLLALDRLDLDPALDPHFDADRRRSQLEQFLE